MSHNQLDPSNDFKRVHTCFDLLLNGLARYGCVIPGYPQEAATIEALAIVKKRKGDWAAASQPAPEPLSNTWNEFRHCIAPVCASLAMGERNPRDEYRLVAWVYDTQPCGVEMAELKAYFETLFTWIAIDAALSCIGNHSGLRTF
jgi:hypothetical protein